MQTSDSTSVSQEQEQSEASLKIAAEWAVLAEGTFEDLEAEGVPDLQSKLNEVRVVVSSMELPCLINSLGWTVGFPNATHGNGDAKCQIRIMIIISASHLQVELRSCATKACESCWEGT